MANLRFMQRYTDLFKLNLILRQIDTFGMLTNLNRCKSPWVWRKIVLPAIESFTRYMSLQTIASPETSGWRGPIEITWRGSFAMPSFTIHCKCMGGWFVLKSIAHGSKCPIELCLPIDAGRKFSWLMKTCSEFPLHLRDAANEVIQIAHVHM